MTGNTHFRGIQLPDFSNGGPQYFRECHECYVNNVAALEMLDGKRRWCNN